MYISHYTLCSVKCTLYFVVHSTLYITQYTLYNIHGINHVSDSICKRRYYYTCIYICVLLKVKEDTLSLNTSLQLPSPSEILSYFSLSYDRLNSDKDFKGCMMIRIVQGGPKKQDLFYKTLPSFHFLLNGNETQQLFKLYLY